jgi:nucleoside-diphosphate-sugar epimerase
VSRAFVTAAERTDAPRGAIYNIGSGSETKLRDVVEIACREMGLATRPRWGTEPQRDWDAKVWVADTALATDELGWSARDDVTTGFRALASWLRGRRDLWTRYGIVVP